MAGLHNVAAVLAVVLAAAVAVVAAVVVVAAQSAEALLWTLLSLSSLTFAESLKHH